MLTIIYDIEANDMFLRNSDFYRNYSYCSKISTSQGIYDIKCIDYDTLSKEDKQRCFNVMTLCGITVKIKQGNINKDNHYVSKVGNSDKQYFFADYDATKDKFIRVFGEIV